MSITRASMVKQITKPPMKKKEKKEKKRKKRKKKKEKKSKV